MGIESDLMHWTKVKVVRKVRETPESFSFVLDVPTSERAFFAYRPGQFINVQIETEGQKWLRSYSLSSSPTGDKHLVITVKKIQNGKVSNFLCDHLSEGDSLLISRPLGEFFYLIPERGVHYVFLAGGSGITPIMSILRAVLMSSNTSRVTLVDVNQNENTVIFKSELEGLARKSRNRSHLKVFHHFSDHSGLMNTERVAALLDEAQIQGRTEYYICGPQGLMDVFQNALRMRNVEERYIHIESFGARTPQAEAATSAQEPVYIGDTSVQLTQEELNTPLEVIFDESSFKFVAGQDQSILDTLLREGKQPPHSCKAGICMACMATVEEGCVVQTGAGPLSKTHIENKKAMMCQARPASKRVRVRFVG